MKITISLGKTEVQNYVMSDMLKDIVKVIKKHSKYNKRRIVIELIKKKPTILTSKDMV